VTPQAICRVGVVGAGQMGAGIAEVCVRAGTDVLVYDRTPELAADGRARVLRSLDRGVSGGNITARERDQASWRLTFTSDLTTFADRQLVIEAVVEDESVKTGLFAELDAIVTDPDAVLASSSSSIPILKLGMVTADPGRVIGMHFFHPVAVLPLVELVGTLLTTAETSTRAEAFAHDVLGKQVVHSDDRSGYIVNALLVPYLLSAIRMAESGFASVDDIDKGMTLGCAHPMGPLKVADLVGLDTVKAIADKMYEEFREPLYAPPPLLLRMVDAGHLGKKSGRGFHTYGAAPSSAAR
jgi:3-hydroxybutyryl-CoA dehydrogenase